MITSRARYPSGKADWHYLYGRKAWLSARARQLREFPLCAYCKRRGASVPATVVDHIRPHKGDTTLFHEPSNLQSLCKHCHDSAKAREESSGRTLGCGADGVPIDPGHHWCAQ